METPETDCLSKLSEINAFFHGETTVAHGMDSQTLLSGELISASESNAIKNDEL